MKGRTLLYGDVRSAIFVWGCEDVRSLYGMMKCDRISTVLSLRCCEYEPTEEMVIN
ncbi:MAG: hypothetical protein ACKO3K_12130 [Cuspidothrix sp.]